MTTDTAPEALTAIERLTLHLECDFDPPDMDDLGDEIYALAAECDQLSECCKGLMKGLSSCADERDLARAQVAAVIEEAAAICERKGNNLPHGWSKGTAHHLSDLISTMNIDATAALEAYGKRMKAEGMREAAGIAKGPKKMATARETLVKMREDCTDLPEDFLRDLAGSARSKLRRGEAHQLTADEAQILDAIADTWESVRIRIEKAKASLSVDPT